MTDKPEKIDTDRALAVGGAQLVRKAFEESPTHLTAEDRAVMAQWTATIEKGPDVMKPSGATLTYERGLIGRLLTQRGALDEVADAIEARHFYEPPHRDLYTAIIEVDRLGRGLDQTAVVEFLGRNSTIKADWFALIAQCRKDDSDVDTARRVAAVRGAWQRRQIAALGVALYNRAMASSVHDGDLILNDAADIIAGLETPADARAEEMGIGEAARVARREIVRRGEMVGDGKLPGMPTGWPRIDYLLGGWVPGNIIVVKAATGKGKTAFAATGLIKAAKKCLADPTCPNVGSVAMISLEMECHAIATRIIANIGEIDAQDLRLAKLTEAQNDALVRAEREAMALNDIFRVVYRPGLTVGALSRVVRRLMRRKGVPPLKVLVIDYLQLLSVPRMNSREQEVAAISEALVQIAKVWGITVIALSQMNKDGEARESRRIEQDADVVVTLKEAEGENPEGGESHNVLYDIIVQKNRHGVTTTPGNFRMIFAKRYQRFLEIKEAEGAKDKDDGARPRKNWYDPDGRGETD